VSRPADVVREVVTPEGVPLRFEIGGLGERVGAFAIDCGLLMLAVVALVLVTMIASGVAGGLGVAVGIVVFFLLRSFYFTWFECRATGATPGKRALGLRVIDAHGGMLTPEAVLARNLMREIELFVPLAVLFAPDATLPARSPAARLLALGWLALLVAMPLLNRDRMRVGDLVGGTLVVRSPTAVLLEDLSATSAATRSSAPAADFTAEQLDLYGIRELQVLESLLRQRSPRTSTLEAVARQIQVKIGWSAALPVDAEAFLRAFYTAQRARLEQRLLLGERRESKRDRPFKRRP